MIVGVLAQDQVMGYELMIPGLVFGMAKLAATERADNDSPQYEVRVCGQSPSIRTVADWGMVEIRTPHRLDALMEADLVMVPGTHRFLEDPDPEAVSALRAAAAKRRPSRLTARRRIHIDLPIDGEPADVVSVVEAYGRWLAESDVPKLFIKAQPGAVVNGRTLQLIRTWPNLTETTVSGIHFVQEDSPDEIGTAVAKFVRNSRLSGGQSPKLHGRYGRLRRGIVPTWIANPSSLSHNSQSSTGRDTQDRQNTADK